jgi:transcriptional regulator with XRE-family HTH domain
MTIGELMKQKRISMKMTQADVGRAIGVDRATIQRWENDLMDIKRDRIEDICKTLHIDPAIFCHPNEVIFAEERQLIEAWRSADELTKAMVRRNLGLEEKNDISESKTSII